MRSRLTASGARTGGMSKRRWSGKSENGSEVGLLQADGWKILGTETETSSCYRARKIRRGRRSFLPAAVDVEVSWMIFQTRRTRLLILIHEVGLLAFACLFCGERLKVSLPWLALHPLGESHDQVVGLTRPGISKLEHLPPSDFERRHGAIGSLDVLGSRADGDLDPAWTKFQSTNRRQQTDRYCQLGQRTDRLVS